jgi:hypothetical protein
MSKLFLLVPLLFSFASALPHAARAAGPVTPDVTIAFFGDQGLGGDAEAVLELIRDEGADAVIHMGDFDYEDDPAAWEAQIDAFLGADFPYFASAGNHDEGMFYEPGGYQEVLEARMNRLGVLWDGDLGVRSSFHFEGIFIVFTAPDSFGDGDEDHAPYIRDVLAADDSVWSVSAWHKNMTRMQVGGKSDDTGWGVYDESRRGGAVIATAHEHSYSRSHLLADVENQVVASTEGPLVLAADDPATPEDEGRSFVFVSGLGGQSIRNQEIDGPWWASIYASDQGARSGALFGTFNYQGDPNLARFYFKDIAGEVVDDFFVTSALEPAPPTLRIDDVVVTEGDSGSREAMLRVTLLGASGEEVAVDYATKDGDASAGSDYDAASGRLAFSGDVTEQSVRVAVRGDVNPEAEESFFVELSAPEGAIVGRARGTVTVLDDDAAPEPRRLEVGTQGSGFVTLDPPGGVYPPGTQVTLTALPAPGHVFTGWDGDLTGAESPASLVMDRDLRVGAHFVALETSLQEVESGSSTESSLVSTDAPLVAADGHLYLAAIASKPNVAVTSVSGLGLAWSPVHAQCAGRGQTGVSVWQARGEPTAAGVVTAAFSESAVQSVLAVSRYAGVGVIDPRRGMSANSIGIAGDCTGGTDGDAYALEIDTITSDSLVYVAAAVRHRDHLPGPGFVERAELSAGSSGNVAGLSVADLQADAAGPVPVAGGFDGVVDWAVVALEIPDETPFQLSVEPSSGGNVVVDPPFDAYVAGATVTLTAIAEPGHRFTGWSGDLAGEENPATLVMDASKTVGAGFVRQVGVILATGSGGFVTLDPPGGLYDEGTRVTFTAVPQPRHRFTGWAGELTGVQNPATLVVEARTIVGAGFVRQFDVSAAGSGGSVTLDPPGGRYDDGSHVTLTAVPDAGHRFSGWSGVLSGAGNPATLVVEADETILARFVPQFRVGVSAAAGGSVTLDPPGGLYDGGTPVTLSAHPAPRHRFTGWSGALAGAENPATLVVDADQSVGAGFVAQFELGVAPGAGGSVALDPPGGVYDQGSSVTLRAVPDAGHRFSGWSGALAGDDNPATLLIDADASVGASFVAQFSVTVEADAGGSVTLDPPGGLYDQGATVTLAAIPSAGRAFAGWDGDLAGAASPASLVADRDLHVVARFVALVSLQEVASGASANARLVATSGPVAAVDGDLYLAAIAFKPNAVVTGVSGLGLAWSPLRHQCAGRGQTGLAVWQARGQPGADGVVTATLSAPTLNAVLAVSRYAGAGAPALPRVVSANTTGLSGACTGGEDDTAYAFDLETLAPHSLVYLAAAARQRDHAPGPGFTERVELFSGAAGNMAGLSVADLPLSAPGRTAVEGQFDAPVDWAVVGVEIPLP